MRGVDRRKRRRLVGLEEEELEELAWSGLRMGRERRRPRRRVSKDRDRVVQAEDMVCLRSFILFYFTRILRGVYLFLRHS